MVCPSGGGEKHTATKLDWLELSLPYTKRGLYWWAKNGDAERLENGVSTRPAEQLAGAGSTTKIKHMNSTKVENINIVLIQKLNNNHSSFALQIWGGGVHDN